MSFISYAQNFEDVMLWRALKDIENGFYIDVGAAWPDTDSVTKAFYDHGWTGINIEPNPSFIDQYAKKRPKDINLQVAVSNESGVAELYFIDDTGLSSLDKSIAESHTDAGFKSTPSEVKLTTLSNICKEHAQEREIHFLKVDVEGFEKNVLISNNWSKYRPWIVVAEATLPLTQEENYDEWEPILIESGYIFVYADGLNRFYIAKEHLELMDSFKYPPNDFDRFKLAAQKKAEARKVEAEAKTREAEAKTREAEARATESERRADDALHHYHMVTHSLSWKITKPLRYLMKHTKSILGTKS